MKQSSFNCNDQDKYVELFNSEMKVTNILLTKTYEVTEEEKVPIIKNGLGREGLQLIQTFRNAEKEACKTVNGLLMDTSHSV